MKGIKSFSPFWVGTLLLFLYVILVVIVYFLDPKGKVISHALVLATVMAVGVALFKDVYFKSYYRGKIRTNFNYGIDCISKDPRSMAGSSIYIRLAIENVGNTTTEFVEIYLKEIEIIKGIVKGEFVPDFVKWSYGSRTLRRLPSDDQRYCDLFEVYGRIYANQNNINKEKTCEYILQCKNRWIIVYPGEYKIYASISGDGMKTMHGYFKCFLPRRWSDKIDGWRATGLRIEWYDE